MANQDDLDAVIGARCLELDADDLIEALVAADVLCAPILGPREVTEDPQVCHNEMIVSTDHQSLGPVSVTGVPIHFGTTPGAVVLPPPRLGQHTSELLAELGYDEASAAELLANGAARSAPDPAG
jgi:formyl-CoA transferase/CoA:oxalate CoA-transferase